MLSLFGVLNMAGQSLSVETQATAVSGQNLANVSNPAYADEQLHVQAAPSLDTTSGDEGTGVQATKITQLWDSLLNSQIVAEDSVSGSLNSQQSALQQTEAYLNEQLSSSSSTGTSSSNGLAADLSGLFNSLQTLSTDPTSIPDRQAVAQSAQQLTQQFNSVSSGLTTVASDLNTSIQNGVTSSNNDLSQIAALNEQIINAQADGGTDNNLIDQREKTIEDLAGYANITTSAQSNGAVNVSIGGVTMVADGATPDSLQTYTNSSGQLMIQAQNAGTPLTLTGGSIEGSITTRDGQVATLQNSINTLASTLITQFNSVYSGGYDLNNNSTQDFFTGSDAASIGVNSTVVNDPTTFQASGTSGATGDNTVVLSLANLASQSLSSLSNQTLSQSYAATIGDFGSALQSVNSQISNSTAVSQMLTTQRSSETGVDTDTEMTNLMQYQKAYEASAELITTVNQMLETLIDMKTV
jgi:flagellar hook-associated protein 1 FlgK